VDTIRKDCYSEGKALAVVHPKGRMVMKKYTIFLFLVFTLLLSACRSKSESQYNPFLTPPAMSVVVTRDNCPSMEVQLGMQVWWINSDADPLPIMLEQLDDDGNVVATGKSEINLENKFSMQFDNPGIYRLYCSENRDTYATITVK